MSLDYGGPITYSIVGSPTITNGVASGVDASNYFQLPQQNFLDKNFEVQVAFTTPSTMPSSNTTLFYVSRYRPNSTQADSSCILFTSTKVYTYWSYQVDGTTPFTASFNASPSTKYYVKAVQQQGNIVVSYRTENTPFVEIKSGTDYGYSGSLTTNIKFGNNNRLADSTIDFNNTYIKVNGKLWFYQPRDISSITYSGPVGYNKSGSPTITNGIVSGIDSTNFLQVAQQFTPQTVTERVVKLKFNASAIGSGRYHNVFYGPTSFSLVFYAASDANKINSVSCYLPGSSSSLFYGSALLEANTWYWFKYTYDGTTASLYKSTDGRDYEPLHSVSATISGSASTCQIGNRWNGDASFFDGEIDMNETYMYLNGKLWFWQPREVEKVYYNNTLVWEK